MKIAVVHDWLVTYAGAERVLGQILRLYPEADLFSLIDFFPERHRHFLLDKRATTSFLQGIPFARKKYRALLPLMPRAVEGLRLSGYDLVISSSYAVAKGALTREGQAHICYCHSPIRYAWDLRRQYLEESGLDRGLKAAAANLVLDYIRDWDRRTACRVDQFIANSHYIADRIKRAYGRESMVIYPPVNTSEFELGEKKEDFFLTASRMVPYKKMDLIAEAFSGLGRRLVVIGDGPGFKKVRAGAGKNVELLGYQEADVLRDYLRKARAFVHAAEEDFGIVLVEAQACGTPVIAYGKGGAKESVIENRTGVFFNEQTVESLQRAVIGFEKMEGRFNPSEIRLNAERFGAERFRKQFRDAVEGCVRRRSGKGSGDVSFKDAEDL